MDDFIGVNLRREDPLEYLNNLGFVRDYHNWAIAEGDVDNPNGPAGSDYPATRSNGVPATKARAIPNFRFFTTECSPGWLLLAMRPIIDPFVRPSTTPCPEYPGMAIMAMNDQMPFQK